MGSESHNLNLYRNVFIIPLVPADTPIVFYDSDCGFCSGVVRFVLDHEVEPRLRFAALDGQTARDAGIDPKLGLRSMIVMDGEKVYLRSRAVRHAMLHMGGKWIRFSRLMGLIPPPLADVGYRVVARMRRLLPGEKSCEILAPEHRERFLP